MLEIISNFKNSLDLFELATFGTKVALQYFGSFPTKRRLEVIDILVFFSENLTLQYALGTKVQRIEIRRFWQPLCGRNKARNLFFKPFLVDTYWVRWCWVLLVCEQNIYFPKASIPSLNIFPIIFGIYCDNTVNVYKWGATIGRYGGSLRRLSSGGPSQV